MKQVESIRAFRPTAGKLLLGVVLLLLVLSSLLPHHATVSAAKSVSNVQIGAETVALYESFSAHPSRLCPGGTIGYSIRVDNESLSTQPSQPLDLEARLDPATSYIVGSAPSSVIYNTANHTLHWQHQLAPGESTTLAFSVTVNSGAAFGHQIALNTTGMLGEEIIDTFVVDTITCGKQVFLPFMSSTPTISASASVAIYQRRAAQIIEDARNTDSAPGWEQAALDGTVQAFYRPDIAGVAYYEFGVAPEGFVVVSTGQHDMMAPHWNYLGASPSADLVRMARENNQTAVKFYKLDALVYVAENANGELVATIAQLPAKISGLDSRSSVQESVITAVDSAPETPILDDAAAAGVERVTRSTGPISSTIAYSAWESWGELKAGYRETYGVLIDDVARDAAEDWALAASPERIRVGETRQLALVDAATTFQLRGVDASSVRVTRRERSGLPPVLDIEVLANPVSGTRPAFEVVLSMPNAGSETARFFIIDPLPQLRAPQGSWSNWTTYSAGTETAQRRYDQYTLPDGCASGCGPTAWAMLFGWADYQAANGNATWAGRWGIYRVNGGYGADAVAPLKMDKGIEAIMLEIRNYVYTFCILGQGATLPQRMEYASRYLKNRSGIRISTHYNIVLHTPKRLRIRVRDSIIDRKTPVVVGTGNITSAHYPLAWKYRFRTRSGAGTKLQAEFYVNSGWGGSGNGWVAASTWFAGEIYPK